MRTSTNRLLASRAPGQVSTAFGQRQQQQDRHDCQVSSTSTPFRSVPSTTSGFSRPPRLELVATRSLHAAGVPLPSWPVCAHSCAAPALSLSVSVRERAKSSPTAKHCDTTWMTLVRCHDTLSIQMASDTHLKGGVFRTTQGLSDCKNTESVTSTTQLLCNTPIIKMDLKGFNPPQL